MTNTKALYNTADYDELSKDVKYDIEKFKDPYVVGAMIHRLVEERKLTNQMLRDIHKKINELTQLMKQKGIEPPADETLLPEQDTRIIEFVREKGSACSEDVQNALGYKGKNGASARMNALSEAGILQKKRVGRKVYFLTR